MNSPQAARPSLFLYLFRIFAILGAVPFLINTVDILLHLNSPSLDPDFDSVLRFVMGLAVAPLTLVIAALCIRRAPSNLIGWMLVMFAYGASVHVMRYDLLPLGAGILISNFVIGAFWIAFLLIPLYFPDGRLYPARANRWGNPILSFIFVFVILISNLCNTQLTWGSGANQIIIQNPLLVFAWNYTVVTIPMMIAIIIAGIITVILRYRNGTDLERLQLRWLLFGVLVQGLLTILIFWNPPWFEQFSDLTNSLYGLIIPIAIGIAVLRYRLYDIDLIIRRTLQYGLLTILLGSVYFGLVVFLEGTFRAMTGQVSPLAVVISTLAIAALFNPLRRRVQQGIDRRFYRRRYNAAAALDRFSQNLRNRVDMDDMKERMLAVVEETMQPEQITVWLKPFVDRKPEVN
jgi:hypothetical protein